MTLGPRMHMHMGSSDFRLWFALVGVSVLSMLAGQENLGTQRIMEAFIQEGGARLGAPAAPKAKATVASREQEDLLKKDQENEEDDEEEVRTRLPEPRIRVRSSAPLHGD